MILGTDTSLDRYHTEPSRKTKINPALYTPILFVEGHEACSVFVDGPYRNDVL